MRVPYNTRVSQAREGSRRPWASWKSQRARPPVTVTARPRQVHGDCPWSPPGCGCGDLADAVPSASRGRCPGLGRDGSKAWQWLGGLTAAAGGPPGPGVDTEAGSAQTVAPGGGQPALSAWPRAHRRDSVGMVLRTAAAATAAGLCVAVPLWLDVHVSTFPHTTFIDFFSPF